MERTDDFVALLQNQNVKILVGRLTSVMAHLQKNGTVSAAVVCDVLVNVEALMREGDLQKIRDI